MATSFEKLLEIEEKLREQLLEVQYLIRMHGTLGERGIRLSRARRRGLTMVTCRGCSNTTRSDQRSCDWCDAPLPSPNAK